MKKALSLLLSLTVLLTSVFAFSFTAKAVTYKSADRSFSVSASNLKLPTMLKKGAKFTLGGNLRANGKIKRLNITVFDKNQFKNNINLNKYPDGKSLKLSSYASSVKFEKLSSGVKELIVSAYDENGKSAVFKREFTVLGKAAEPVHITRKCKFRVNKGKAENVTDGNINTTWTNGKMIIELPKNKTADGMQIKWHNLSNNYVIKTFDENGAVLDKYTSKSHQMLHMYFPFSENAQRVEIELKKSKGSKGMCTLRVYEKNRVGVSVERWEAPKKGGCDLMVISTHRDDELLYLGGTIPYYTNVKGKNVYTLYMSGVDRLRHREALAGQWSMGVKACPIFMNFAGGYHDGIKGTLKSWGGENYVLKRVVEQIRKYQPDVIVTQDVNGEYGHPSHKTTSYIVRKAVKLAGDKNKFPDSYKKFGAWKVKKLYVHLYSKNKITMNWKKKSAKMQGKSAFQMATIAYDKHYSQHGSWSMTAEKVTKYPNSKFGLAYTRVGRDKKKNDFFEHIK